MSKIKEIHALTVRSSLTYQENPPTRGRREKNLLPSEAVPDQSLTVRELLRRHTRGTLQDIAHNDVYYNEDFPDMRGLDIVQRRQMLEDNKQFIEETINDEKEKKRKKASDSVLDTLPPSPPEGEEDKKPKT